jgi:transporter family-2 protein
MGSAWLCLIPAAGALRAWGPPMKGALRQGPSNPGLVSFVSFLPTVIALFARS